MRGGFGRINAPCKFWIENRCNKGSACMFIHEEKKQPTQPITKFIDLSPAEFIEAPCKYDK